MIALAFETRDRPSGPHPPNPRNAMFHLALTRRLVLPIAVAAFVGVAAPSARSQDDAVQNATKDPGMYAVFETSMGDVVCRLHYDKVPVTVANFVGLATGKKEWKDPKTGEMVTRPLYDGIKFHRVIKDFMIQGGDPLENGRGGPGYSFTDEFHPDLRHDKPGILSMANSGPNTNGSQFFITHVPTPWLDDKHSIFGEVIAGQDVVDAMAAVEMQGPQKSLPVTDIILEKVNIVRTGPEAEAFDWEAEWAKKDEVIARMEAAKTEREAMQLKQLGETLGVDLSKAVEGEDGLKWVVREEGSGTAPNKGQVIRAHYTGYLTDGTKFDSSVDRGQPFETPIGVGRVIKGWDLAFADMKPGEKRVLIIPSDLGYGARGAGGAIPPNATLVFDVELLEVVK
jgi:peptidylprolyl isomerase